MTFSYIYELIKNVLQQSDFLKLLNYLKSFLCSHKLSLIEWKQKKMQNQPYLPLDARYLHHNCQKLKVCFFSIPNRCELSYDKNEKSMPTHTHR